MAVVAVFAHDHLVDHWYKFNILLSQDLVELLVALVFIGRILPRYSFRPYQEIFVSVDQRLLAYLLFQVGSQRLNAICNTVALAHTIQLQRLAIMVRKVVVQTLILWLLEVVVLFLMITPLSLTFLCPAPRFGSKQSRNELMKFSCSEGSISASPPAGFCGVYS